MKESIKQGRKNLELLTQHVWIWCDIQKLGNWAEDNVVKVRHVKTYQTVPGN